MPRKDMGKHLWTETDGEDNRPGCMRGILHALDYHQWHYKVEDLKKRLPNKKHYGSRNAKCHGWRKKMLPFHASYEVQKQTDAESIHFPIDSNSTKTSSTIGRSLLSHLIYEEISEECCKENCSGFQQTQSIHHLEPPNHTAYGKSNHLIHPITFPHGEADNGGGATRLQCGGHMKSMENPNASDENFIMGGADNGHHSGNLSDNCKEYADALEIFSIEKDLFLKVLKDAGDNNASCSHNLQAAVMQPRLTKSVSFPTSHTRNLRPSKLKHKQNEVWSFPKGEKSSGSQSPKLSSSKFPRDLYTKSDIHVAVDIDPLCNLNKSSGSIEVDSLGYERSIGKMSRINTTSTISESLERYAQLFQNNFNNSPKLHTSKSLNLTNEFEIPSSGHVLRLFKRVRSLSTPDSYFDANFSGRLLDTVVDDHNNVRTDGHEEYGPTSTNKYTPLEANTEASCLRDNVERSNSTPRMENLGRSTESKHPHTTSRMLVLGEEIDEQTSQQSNSDRKLDINLAEIASNELSQPSPVPFLQSFLLEDVICPAVFPNSEGLDCRSSYVDEKRSSSSLQYISRSKKSSIIDGTDFNYVSHILEQSGFNENGFFGPWYSENQLLNPLAFEEIEACWSQEPQYSGDEICSSSHHRLLFDMVNEALLQIYDSSFTYYPKALNSNCHMHPIPKDYHILKDVWARIIRTSSLGPRADQLTDSIVAQDLAKEDGWMNLQLESECAALELEEMIFDELLEEILFYGGLWFSDCY